MEPAEDCGKNHFQTFAYCDSHHWAGMTCLLLDENVRLLLVLPLVSTTPLYLQGLNITLIHVLNS